MRRAFALALILMLPVAPGTLGDPEPPEERAETFARLFVEGRHDEAVPLMDETMRGAFGAAQAEPLRTGLIASQGAVKAVGRAWQADVLQGYRRFRVPVEFEKGVQDLLVVLDSADRVAGLFFMPHVERPEAAEPSAAEVEVLIGGPERGLPGTLTLPRSDGPHPAVVLVHGSGPNDRDQTVGPNKPFRDLAWGLAERGVAVLRYDKRSFARPDDLKAIGDALTVREEVIDDARLALGLLRSRAEIDAGRLFVVGHSLGGTLAPRIAGSEPRPAGVVILAGMTLPLPEKMIEQQRYIFLLDGDLSEVERQQLSQLEAGLGALRKALDGETEPPPGTIVGAPFAYYRDLEAYDAPGEAAALGLPLLAIQGGRDYQVTLEDFARWKTALAGQSRACLVVYDELDHLLHRGTGPSTPQDYLAPAEVDPRVIDAVASWILNGSCPAG